MYPLTSSGIELSKIAGCHMELDEFKAVARKIEENTNFSLFKIYRIKEIQGERISYNMAENLRDE